GSKRDGAVTVAAKDLDTAPLVDVFGVFPGREHGPLPVSAKVTIARDSATDILVVRGEEIFGPIRVARKGADGGRSETSIRIWHDMSLQKDEIRSTVLPVAADLPGGRPDRVTARGTVRI